MGDVAEWLGGSQEDATSAALNEVEMVVELLEARVRALHVLASAWRVHCAAEIVTARASGTQRVEVVLSGVEARADSVLATRQDR